MGVVDAQGVRHLGAPHPRRTGRIVAGVSGHVAVSRRRAAEWDLYNARWKTPDLVAAFDLESTQRQGRIEGDAEERLARVAGALERDREEAARRGSTTATTARSARRSGRWKNTLPNAIASTATRGAGTRYYGAACLFSWFISSEHRQTTSTRAVPSRRSRAPSWFASSTAPPLRGMSIDPVVRTSPTTTPMIPARGAPARRTKSSPTETWGNPRAGVPSLALHTARLIPFCRLQLCDTRGARHHHPRKPLVLRDERAQVVRRFRQRVEAFVRRHATGTYGAAYFVAFPPPSTGRSLHLWNASRNTPR